MATSSTSCLMCNKKREENPLAFSRISPAVHKKTDTQKVCLFFWVREAGLRRRKRHIPCFSAKRENALILLRLLSPAKPLRWVLLGAPVMRAGSSLPPTRKRKSRPVGLLFFWCARRDLKASHETRPKVHILCKNGTVPGIRRPPTDAFLTQNLQFKKHILMNTLPPKLNY